MKRAPLLLGLLLVGRAQAQDAAPVERLREIEEEHSRVEHWLRELSQQQGEVLAVLEAVESETRKAEGEARRARAAVEQVRLRLEAALQREKELWASREAQARELAPRLRLRARLSGGDSLGAMLSTENVGGFLWRRRMLDRLLADDLRLVQSMARVSQQAEETRKSIEAERESLAKSESEALERAEAARARRAEQFALLSTLNAQKRTHQRTVKELEVARGKLLELLALLPPTPPGLGGFGARRGSLAWPVAGEVTLGFGLQTDPRHGTQVHHKGIDLSAAPGTRVVAPHPAVVGFAGWFRGFGNLVVLDHGEGYFTLYAHLESLEVERGQGVEQGAVIGTLGDTGSLKGPLLYFEVRSGAKPLDPALWLAPRR